MERIPTPTSTTIDEDIANAKSFIQQAIDKKEYGYFRCACDIVGILEATSFLVEMVIGTEEESYNLTDFKRIEVEPPYVEITTTYRMPWSEFLEDRTDEDYEKMSLDTYFDCVEYDRDSFASVEAKVVRS